MHQAQIEEAKRGISLRPISYPTAPFSISAPPFWTGLQGNRLLSLCWILFLRKDGVWLDISFLCELGVGGFIVSSRCWSSQDRWVRLESDTYSKLSHRDPLYIEPYYHGQIAVALAVCLGMLVGRRNTKLKVQPTHCPLDCLIFCTERVLNVCLCACVWVCVCEYVAGLQQVKG